MINITVDIQVYVSVQDNENYKYNNKYKIIGVPNYYVSVYLNKPNIFKMR